MLITMNMGSEDTNRVSESPPAKYNDFKAPEKFTASGIPAPPPPPPPIRTAGEPPRDLFQRFNPKRRSRLRNFNWEAIPPEKVRGRSSLWSSETFLGDLQIDTGTIEELFGKQEEEVQPRSSHPRRSLSAGDAHVNKVFLLDSRRSMNIAIFLKQFKRSAAQIVDDIRKGKADIYSSERLTELLKHLPDREEVQRLKSFQGDRERLSEADLFMLLLLDVPSYSLRLEALILKKDFHPAIVSQLAAAREIKTAVDELLHCSELHFILKLVLKAGNFMNAGGYAGNAAGFRVSSLLKLADTKANKPGMNLLHFVVMEVQKKDPKYLSFADKLKHVQSASRVSEDNLLEEFSKLQSRVKAMHQNLAPPEQQELRHQMEEFLEYAAEQLQEVQREIDELHSAKHNLAEFLCEDQDAFHLEECCKVFSCFCQKFQMAIKENKVRELEEQRQQEWEKKRLQKRHSMATCASIESPKDTDELEVTLERNLRNLWRTSSVRLCRMRSLGSHSPTSLVPQSVQRERIQEYCDQKNAEQMREVSERVLRQQLEYKSSSNIGAGNKSGFYPVSMNTSLPKDRTDLSERETQTSKATDTSPIQPAQEESHYTSEVKYLNTPKIQDPQHSKTKSKSIERQLDNSDLETAKATEVMQMNSHLIINPLTLTIPTQGLELDTQSLSHLSHGSDHKAAIHSRDAASSHVLTHPACDMHCQVPSQDDKDDVFIQESNNRDSGRSLKPLHQQQHSPSKIPQSTLLTHYHAGSETLKPIPECLTSSDSQFLPQSYPEHSTSQVSLDKQGISALYKPRVPSKSKIPKQLPIKYKDVNSAITQDQSHLQDFATSRLDDVAGDETKEPSCDFTVHDKDGSLEPVEQTESNAIFQNGASIQAFNHQVTSNESVPSSKTLPPTESDNGHPTSVYPPPESMGQDDSSQLSKQSPPQPSLKTFKQTLIKSAVRNPRQSSPMSSPSLAQRRNEAANQNQYARPPLSQPGSFMTRIKHVEHLSVKLSGKETNGQATPQQHNASDLQNGVSKDAQPQDSDSSAKSLKNAVVNREAPNPCSKWKRELRNAPEKVDSGRIEYKTENNNVGIKNNTEHKSGEIVKNTLARTGIPKKLKNNDLGVRKVLVTKDVTTGPVNPPVAKQLGSITKTDKDGKRLSVGSIKPALSKSMRSFREKRESGLINSTEHIKPEHRHSPLMTPRRASTEGQSGEQNKEPLWSQVSPKKTSSVARVAIHVIKHYEVTSTITRGSRSPYLTSHPVWR